MASIVLPLRHLAHMAKAAASADVLSEGRIILGVALPFAERGVRFRASFDYIERMWDASPAFENIHGCPDGDMDMLPKPAGGKLLLITGASQEAPDWIARRGAGWINDPRPASVQAKIVADWRARVEAVGGAAKPAMQSLSVDLTDDPDMPPQPIHLGFRSGVLHLRAYLKELGSIGVNHVVLNLRFNHADIETTIHRLAAEVLPDFSV